jgi:Pyruvate/2-oxoacid:ferredoxin oxidoreductase delta subunit
MCGLGHTAPNPVLSTLRYFRDEYLRHIEEKTCPAAVCKALIEFSINEKCPGCTLCLLTCPEKAITGEKGKLHIIDTVKCIKCGVCKSICQYEAVDVR